MGSRVFEQSSSGINMASGLTSLDVQNPLPNDIQALRAKVAREFAKKEDDKPTEVSEQRIEELIANGHSHIVLNIGLRMLKSNINSDRWLKIVIENAGEFLSIGDMEAVCSKIVERRIPSVEANRYLIEKNYRLKNWDEIIELSHRFDSESNDDIEVILKVITAFKKSGKSEGLIEFIPKLGSYSELDLRCLRELALSYFKNKNYFHSSKIWKKIGFDNLNRKEMVLAAKASYNLERYVDSWKICSLIDGDGNMTDEVSYLSIRACYMSGDWERCIAESTDSISRNSKNAKKISEYRSKAVANVLARHDHWYQEIKIGA